MKNLIHRLYADYLMPSRLAEYEALLRQAAASGYKQLSVRAFHRALATADGPPMRVLVHRHDIDSDLRTARKMFEIETRHGVQASYYFRLCTLDISLMREIEAAGSEASYHYEEVADFAKRHRIRRADALRQRFPEIAEQFTRNAGAVSERLGLPLTTVASHGDFVNRRLQVFNHELLRDRALRARCGIERECYDSDLLSQFDIYISDLKYPHYYRPMSPFDALGRYDRIMFLTHPMQWETNWVDTSRGNVRRLAEELAWRTA